MRKKGKYIFHNYKYLVHSINCLKKWVSDKEIRQVRNIPKFHFLPVISAIMLRLFKSCPSPTWLCSSWFLKEIYFLGSNVISRIWNCQLLSDRGFCCCWLGRRHLKKLKRVCKFSNPYLLDLLWISHTHTPNRHLSIYHCLSHSLSPDLTNNVHHYRSQYLISYIILGNIYFTYYVNLITISFEISYRMGLCSQCQYHCFWSCDKS